MNIHSSITPVSPVAGTLGMQLPSPSQLSDAGREALLGSNGAFPSVAKTAETEKPNGAKQEKSTEARNDSAGTRHEDARQKAEQQQERQEINELAARDREVRAHEQAHMAVGGQYAGAASYEYTRGPNGVNYATGGEVPISTGKESTPQATIQKAQIVRRAALAPAEPSPQDRSVAAKASAMEAQARKEIAEEGREKIEENGDEQSSSKETIADKGLQNEASKPSETTPEREPTPTPLPGSIGGRLIQSVSNTILSSHSPGRLLDQIA